MTPQQKLARLSLIADMLMDRELADLRRKAEARAASQAHLEDLARPRPPTDLPPVAAHRAELVWQVWAERRRGEINITLARQTAEWLEAREAAKTAFSRAEVLRALRRKPPQAS